MKPLTICVLGGSGFVGHHLVNRLVKEGHAVRLILRRRERHRELLVLPGVRAVQGSVHDEALLRAQFSGCDVVINLIAVLHDARRGGFATVHVELPRKVVAACVASGVTRLLHMSALNADAQHSPSAYLRSKGQGEDIAHAGAAQGLQVTSFRPSVIFGEGDHFFNTFAGLLRLPVPLLLPCAQARFAPVYVGDVVQAMCVALHHKHTPGQRYDLCGPQAYTLQALVEYTAKVVGSSKSVIPLGLGLSSMFARVMAWMPGKPLTPDNVASMSQDNVCKSGPAPELGLVLSALETVVPTYLRPRDLRARYYDLRRAAGRKS